jgi:hypothetical protein
MDRQGNRFLALFVAARKFLPLSLVLIFLVISPVAKAQTGGQGALQGTVTDSTGAVIPGATVTATDQSSGVSTTRVASSAGLYIITPLIPDTYTVTVTAKGFAVSKQENIVVNGMDITGYSAKLKVGSTEETVTVSQAPPALQTENATLGTVIDNATYESLPVLMSGSSPGTTNGRDPTAFALLSTGTQSATRAPDFGATGQYLAEVYLDGIPTTTANQQGDNRVISMSMPVESIDQLQVISSSPTAEYQGAGAIGFTSHSGGKQYHGTILDVIRNTAFDTWGFTAPAGTVTKLVNGVPTKVPAPKPSEHQNELSISAGGPIPFSRHKGFFFANFDKYAGTNGVSPSNFTVPTTLMTQGDFTDLGTGTYIYNPLTNVCTTPQSCTRQPFMGMKNGAPTVNVIPTSFISPISLYEEQFIPAPTSAGIANNYLGGGVPTGYKSVELVTKLDYDITAGHRFSFLMTKGASSNFGFGANLPMPYVNGDTYRIAPLMIVLEDSYVITPHMVNQFKYGFTRFPQPVKAPTDFGNKLYSATTAGITGLPVGQASGNFPGISFASSTAFPSSQTTWTENGAADASHNVVPNAYTLLDDLQWTKGRHSMTFGLQMQWLQDNTTAQTSPSGIFTQAFSPISTANYVGANLSSTATGYGYASFLLGAVNSAGTSVPLFVETGGRYKPISPYFQDDWKIRPNLTVNLGLRWDYLPPYLEVQDRYSFFNPNGTNPITNSPGTLEFAGNRGADISCQCRTPINTYWKHFGPRLGVAWSFNPKTVLRAGFGITYTRSGGLGGRGGDSTGTGQSGFNSTIILPTAQNTGVGAGPSFYLNNGTSFQSAGLANTNFGGPGYSIPAPTPPNASALTIGTGNYVNSSGAYIPGAGASAWIDPYLSGRAPEFESYNLGIDRALTRNITIQVSYAGDQTHFIGGPSTPGFWSGQLDPKYVAEFGSTLGTDNATNILNAPATPANLAIAQAIDPTIKVPYAGYVATNAPSSATIGRMLRPFPQYSSPPGPQWNQIGNFSYNSLQLTLRQREWKGLSYTLNYTYSKSIGDDANGASAFAVPAIDTSAGIALPGNNRAARALTGQDIPQNLNVYGLANLPFGKDHIGGEYRVVRILAGGWSLSGIYTYSSGTPIQFGGSGCTFPSAGACYPDINPTYSGSIRRNGSFGQGITAANLGAISYLNPAAFQLPSVFPLPANALAKAVATTKIGNAPRSNAYHAFTPGTYNVSMSIRRSFNITPERVKFLFQADCTNVTNKVTFGGISTGWSASSSTTFGQISKATGNRDFQFSGRITF